MRGKRRRQKIRAVRERAAGYGPGGGEVVFYRSPDGSVTLNVKLDKDTIWLSQKQMAVLFGKDTDTIGLHIRNAFKEKELDEQATTEDFSVVQREGKRSVRRTVRSTKRRCASWGVCASGSAAQRFSERKRTQAYTAA